MFGTIDSSMVDSSHLHILNLALRIALPSCKIIGFFDIAHIHEQLPYQDTPLVLTGPQHLVLVVTLANPIINLSHVVLHWVV